MADDLPLQMPRLCYRFGTETTSGETTVIMGKMPFKKRTLTGLAKTCG